MVSGDGRVSGSWYATARCGVGLRVPRYGDPGYPRSPWPFLRVGCPVGSAMRYFLVQDAKAVLSWP